MLMFLVIRGLIRARRMIADREERELFDQHERPMYSWPDSAGPDRSRNARIA